MNTYKIKRILDNSIIISYRTDNGTLKELEIFVNSDWSKERIEEEIAAKKQAEDKQDVKINLSDYFSVGEELEFVKYTPEEDYWEEEKRLQEEQEKILQEENEALLKIYTDYRNTPVDYKAFRWQEYPSFEEQLDALYWMRQGVMEPIEELDKKISTIKEKYPKDGPVLTNADLDAAFPESRSTDYLDDLRSRGIQADFL